MTYLASSANTILPYNSKYCVKLMIHRIIMEDLAGPVTLTELFKAGQFLVLLTNQHRLAVSGHTDS
jgi:hypothetical protein